MADQRLIERLWYEGHPLSAPLIPISWLYCFAVQARNFFYKTGLLPGNKVSVPVIVVGNITVGGTGKTPFVIWLCNYLVQQGHRPGILSRGYRGKRSKRPQQVRPDSDPLTAGDEPVLIARRTNRPVAVSGDRYMAAKQLLEHTDCDVLICDDGLQHLSLERDLEIALVDGDRRFGNRHCLPAGPLREPVSRLTGVDMVVSRDMACKNEFLMKYAYGNLISIKDNREMAIEDLNDKSVHVVTGIANPLRFYAYLKGHNIRIIKHEYPDHYRFSHKELQFDDEFPVVMTEKDAVKCKGITGDNLWYLPVTATFDEVFHHRINSLLKDMFDG